MVRLADGYVDLDAREVVRGGAATRLTPTDHKLLSYLVERSGQVVEAAALLRDVWGYREGVETRAVHHAIRRLRVKIEPDPSEPAHLTTVFGVGVQWLPLADVNDGSSPKPGTAPRAAPSSDDAFIGREAALGQVLEALKGPQRLGTITGPGGIGKTRLAMEVARRWGGELLWLSLVGVEARDAFLERVAVHLEIALHRDPAAEIGAALRRRGALVVTLDNMEQLTQSAAGLLPGWLRDAPECRLLVTSRQAMRIRDEREVSLPPLETRSQGSEPSAANRLLSERAQQHGVAPDALQGEALEQLSRQLDGLPLAIELAAARLRLIPPQALVQHLSDNVRILQARRRDRPERHTSLDAALRWSWSELGRSAQSTLIACATFAYNFSFDSLSEVLGEPAGDLWADLDALREACFLQPPRPSQRDPGREARWSLLRPVRGFVEQRARGDHPDWWRVCRQRHAAWVGRLGEIQHQAGLDAEGGWRRRRLRALVEDIQRALEGCAEPALTAQLTRAMISAYIDQIPTQSLAGVLARGRDRCEGAPVARLHTLGFVNTSWIMPWLGLSLEQLDAELALARAEAPELTPFVLGHIARLHQQGADYERADAVFVASINAARACGFEALAAAFMARRANVIRASGDLAAAREAFGDALAAVDAAGDVRAAASAMNNMGILAAQEGRSDEAASLFRRAIDKARATDTWRLLADAHSNLGVMLFQDGRHAPAFDAYTCALDFAQRSGDLCIEMRVLLNTADFHLTTGEPALAERLLRDGIARADTPYTLLQTTLARVNLVAALVELGRFDEALTQAQLTKLAGDELRHVRFPSLSDDLLQLTRRIAEASPTRRATWIQRLRERLGRVVVS